MTFICNYIFDIKIYLVKEKNYFLNNNNAKDINKTVLLNTRAVLYNQRKERFYKKRFLVIFTLSYNANKHCENTLILLPSPQKCEMQITLI